MNLTLPRRATIAKADLIPYNVKFEGIRNKGRP